MRILLVAPVHAIGGQAHAAKDIANGFADAPDVGVALVAIDPRLPRPFRFLTTTRYLRSVVRPILQVLQLLFRVPGSDVVHVFCAAHLAFLFGAVPAIMVGTLFRVPIVLNYHDGRAAEHLRRSRWLLPWALRRARAVVVPSDYLRAEFERHGVKTIVIPNVVDPTRFRATASQEIPRRLVSLRLLEPLYAVENTLEALRQLQVEWPDLRLDVYGDGVSGVDLRRLAQALQLRHTRFHGAVPPESIPRILSDGGIVVNSSRLDNTPLFILEAFAAGLPVVTTKAGGIPYLVEHERTGLLVPIDDPAALAGAVDRLLREPGLGAALAAAGRREVLKYTWARAQPAWRQLYGAVARTLPDIPHG